MPTKVKVPPRLWKAIGSLELAGMKLSNIAFNLSQCPGKVLTQEYCDSMKESQREWDAAQSEISRLLK